ncbi:phosphoesterase HXTX [Pedobacter yonginense]|uniref:Phosphoesterase HXTX n=1 Tax=Pedobacter yonginense TaxID=651869 RepID=A0A317EKU1_9SPHI|nr:2'-5' RNA ligase family protein [Pedobacter yonginense]PWS26639.1 phosphoesterase HXTX [Pedobacter yonginense]
MHTNILTAKLDQNAQLFFNGLRKEHFPVERNFLDAHLTLFHKLPHIPNIEEVVESITHSKFNAVVERLQSTGRGVAYFIQSNELSALRHQLVKAFQEHLSPQDLQGFRPHITIQNKVSPEEAKALLNELNQTFKPFEISIEGLDLWHYLDGPWQHYRSFPFMENK